MITNRAGSNAKHSDKIVLAAILMFKSKYRHFIGWQFLFMID